MSTPMTPAAAAAAGFLAIAAFQAALSLGAPLGRAAWGGIHAHLPARLRIASAFAAGVWMLAALIILGRAAFHVSPLPPAFDRWGTWILFGVNLLAAVINFASHSSWERLFWAPVALILAVLCLVVALSGSPVPEADRSSTSINGATASATRAATAGDRCGAFPPLMERNTDRDLPDRPGDDPAAGPVHRRTAGPPSADPGPPSHLAILVPRRVPGAGSGPGAAVPTPAHGDPTKT